MHDDAHEKDRAGANVLRRGNGNKDPVVDFFFSVFFWEQNTNHHHIPSHNYNHENKVKYRYEYVVVVVARSISSATQHDSKVKYEYTFWS